MDKSDLKEAAADESLWTAAGKNFKYAVAGKWLVMAVDLSKRHGRSRGGAGKNEIIGTSSGPQEVVPGTGVRAGVNVMCPLPRKTK